MCSHGLSQSNHEHFFCFFFQCINSMLFFQLKTLRTSWNSLKQKNKCVGKILWALWGRGRLKSSLSMVKVIKNPGKNLDVPSRSPNVTRFLHIFSESSLSRCDRVTIVNSFYILKQGRVMKPTHRCENLVHGHQLMLSIIMALKLIFLCVHV